MGSFSLAHWLIVIVVLLLVFGPKRLSEVGKGLGQGIRNFKKGVGGEDDEDGAVESKPRRVKSRDDAPKRLKAVSKRAPEDADEDAAADDDVDEEEEEARPRRRKKARRG